MEVCLTRHSPERAERRTMTREEARRYMLQWQQELKDGGIPIDSDRIQALRVAIEALREPSGETVSKGVYLQTKWERDTALQTLEEHGIGLGQKADRPTGSWISRIDEGTWMLECSECGCRVQEEKYRIAIGQNATKCPYCGAELGLGGYSYDEYADRPSQRGEDE